MNQSVSIGYASGQNRNSSGGNVHTYGQSGGSSVQSPPVRRPIGGGGGGGKLMRLKCRFRPLHDAYFKNGAVVDEDSDIIFVCGDGHQVRAHKVIMASASVYLSKLFEDQRYDICVINIPDIKVDTMRLILQLTYRDRVILTMSQIKEVGEFLTMFGMAWAQFGYEEYMGDENISAIPMPPVADKPVELQTSGNLARVTVTQPVRKGAAFSRATIATNIFDNGNEEEFNDFPLPVEYDNGGQMPTQDKKVSSHSRKSRLTPRAGTEFADEIVEEDGLDDQSNTQLIKDWMSRLGKRDSNSSTMPLPNEPVKRMKVDLAPEPEAFVKNICTLCGIGFQTQAAWRWHQERHVGIDNFQCQVCNASFRFPKQCFLHEKTHNFSNIAPKPPAATNSVNEVEPKGLLVRPNHPNKFLVMGQSPRPVASEAQKITKRIKLAKLQARRKKEFSVNNKQIGIGESEGTEYFDTKKIKQLHWIYVCQKCDHLSDSASKATVHYNDCYPSKTEQFENTVKKYKQGFYGKSKCPLCPRRYPQNNGFMIHCGHQHQQYRRLFHHTGSVDDGFKCVTCKKKFVDPTLFHAHLEKTGTGEYHCSTTEAASVKPAKPAGTVGRPRARRAESPIETKASYKVQFHTPPRSARLASRAQAEASAEAISKAKSVEANLPPMHCPVCGDSEISDISKHLETKHKDLNVNIVRETAEYFRCKGCTITFNVCDLLDHKDCCTGDDVKKNDPDAFIPQSRRSSTGSQKPVKPPVIVVDASSLPPGVGTSPIERIEIDDLHSLQAIRLALKCAVCGVVRKKLGAVAECLRAHGIHRCSLCFNSYINKNDYALHLKKCHGASSNKLKCPLCPKSFANAGQTSGHMYSTHWLQILKVSDVEEEKDEKDNEGETLSNADEDNTMTIATNSPDGDKVDTVEDDDDAKADASFENVEGLPEAEAIEEDNEVELQLESTEVMDADTSDEGLYVDAEQQEDDNDLLDIPNEYPAVE